MAERDVVVTNKEGLHFRPIMQLVDTAQNFQSRIAVHCDGRKADGRDAMELLMLVATHGSRVKLVGEGEDADRAVEALAKLFEMGFGEN